jgi:ElaB/YqjD/DUF883 family membrane-anchored ribosome-binding protein
MEHPEDEMLDDLHVGVEALKSIARNNTIPLSERALESLNRLDINVPAAQSRFRLWKEKVRDKAVRAAKQTNEAAHNNPWTFTVGAFGVGLLIALLMSGSDDSNSKR